MKTKAIAFLMACLMVFSAFSVVAFADGDVVLCPGAGADHLKDVNVTSYTEVKKVEAKCTLGYTMYRCNNCGDYFLADFVEPTEAHSWDATVEEVAPTCDTAGHTAGRKCSKCGTVEESAYQAPLGHDWEETVDGDCLKGYTKTKVCKRCETTETEIDVPAKAYHTWYKDVDEDGVDDVQMEIIVAPTNTTTGTARYTCWECDATKDVTIQKTTHVHDMSMVKGFDPDCGKEMNGQKTYYICKICGERFYDEAGQDPVIDDNDLIVQFKHTMGDEPTKVEPATCEGIGHITYKCTVCGKETTDDIPATGHNYVETEETVEPTCTEMGYTVKASICTVCGKEKYPTETTIHKATGHMTLEAASKDAKAGLTHDKATCVEDGLWTWTCQNKNRDGSVCGEKCSKVESATGHNLVNAKINATCSTYGVTYQYCANENCPTYGAKSTIVVHGKELTLMDKDGKPVTGAGIHLKEDSVAEVAKIGPDDPNWTKASAHADPHWGETVQPATCTRKESKTDYCLACGYEYTAPGDETSDGVVHYYYEGETLPHAFQENVDAENYEAKDELNECGKLWRVKVKCPDCGTLSDWIVLKDENGNDMQATHQWEVKKVAPTCATEGYSYRECTVCKAINKKSDGLTGVTDFDEDTGYYNMTPLKGNLEYRTFEEAQKDHTGLNRATEDVYVEQNCTKDGMWRYHCDLCDTWVLVWMQREGPKGHQDPGTYDKPGDKAPKAATCTTPGNTAFYHCSKCGEFVEGEEIAALGHHYVKTQDKKDPTCVEDGKEEVYECERKGQPGCVDSEEFGPVLDPDHPGTVIPALGHDWEDVPAKSASCKEAGYSAHKKCTRCDATEGKVEDPQKKHELAKTDFKAATCTTAGYEHYDCPWCEDVGEEYIVWIPAENHAWSVQSETPATDCTHPGSKTSVCDNCGAVKTEDVVKPHVNAAGEEFYTDCTDPIEDRHCTVCEKDYPHDKATDTHTYAVYDIVEGNCIIHAHVIYRCVFCGETKEVVGELGDHVWGPFDEETMTRVCQLCGELDTGLLFTLEADNAVVPGAGLTASSLLAVKVSISGADKKVLNVGFTLKYNPAVLTFEKAEIISANFSKNVTATELGNGFVTVSALATSKDPADRNVTIGENEEFAIVYFRVNNVDNAEDEVSFAKSNEVEKAFLVQDDKGSVIYAAGFDSAQIVIREFMDFNGDGNVDIIDVLAADDLATGKSYEEDGALYSVVLDVNKDGEITLEDVVAIYKCFMGELTIEDVLALRPEE